MPIWTKALARLQDLANGKYADNAPALSNLGRVFTESAATNPNYFAVPGRTPTANLGALSAKHGLPVTESNGSVYAGPKLSIEPREATAGQAMKMMAEEGRVTSRDPTATSIIGALRRKEIDNGTPLRTIDAMDAQAGSGQAKQAYPALYELILAAQEANLAPSLTMPNMKRRTSNMVGSLEKFGDIAGNRLMISNDQLGNVGDVNRTQDYHKLPTDAKIGLLNSLAAQDTQYKVNSFLKNSAIARQDHPLNVEMRRLGLEGGWNPTTDVDKEYFPSLAELMRNAAKESGVTQPVGIDSLRRAALTFDHLGGGLTAGDIATQPFLTNGIARKTGGSIPGALTACSCKP